MDHNLIGDGGARELLQGLVLRKEAGLPVMKLIVTVYIAQETYQKIIEYSTSPKKKKKKKGKKVRNSEMMAKHHNSSYCLLSEERPPANSKWLCRITIIVWLFCKMRIFETEFLVLKAKADWLLNRASNQLPNSLPTKDTLTSTTS